jgi:hypothetical protein
MPVDQRGQNDLRDEGNMDHVVDGWTRLSVKPTPRVEGSTVARRRFRLQALRAVLRSSWECDKLSIKHQEINWKRDIST